MDLKDAKVGNCDGRSRKESRMDEAASRLG
jgi:hypothetical protein